MIPLALSLVVGCEEQKQLNTEAATLQSQLEQLQAEERVIEDELKAVNLGTATAKDNVVVRKAGITIDQKKETMEAEVKVLRDRKALLQKETESLSKFDSNYRQKYL